MVLSMTQQQEMCLAYPRDIETDALHLADPPETVLNRIETGMSAPGTRVRVGITVVQRLRFVGIPIVVYEGTETD